MVVCRGSPVWRSRNCIFIGVVSRYQRHHRDQKRMCYDRMATKSGWCATATNKKRAKVSSRILLRRSRLVSRSHHCILIELVSHCQGHQRDQKGPGYDSMTTNAS